MINVTATLSEKKNNYYAVLYYRDLSNKPVRKTIRTGIKSSKGNKRNALKKVEEIRTDYEDNLNNEDKKETKVNKNKSDTRFCDYMVRWLETIRPTIAKTTYMGYHRLITGRIFEYFNELGILLCDLKPSQIQEFYEELYSQGLKTNTVLKYHANIRKALQTAVKKDLIDVNPADKIDKPKAEEFIGSFYTKLELQKLFSVVDTTNMKLPILLASYYGLRRSEVLGLKWSAVDFENKIVHIRHTIGKIKENGVDKIIGEDKTKNKSSHRALPLIPEIEEILIEEQKRQQEFKLQFGGEYMNFEDYICVNEQGKLLIPDYISHKFNQILQDNELRHIRFHDLRHSCASLLLHNNVQMKDIQVWLGHSNYSTTANLYAHVDVGSKEKSANVIGGILNN